MSITRTAQEPSTAYNERVRTPLTFRLLATCIAVAGPMAIAAACSSSSTPPPGAGPPDSGSLLGDVVVEAPVPACAETAPQQGSACGPQGLACEYGTATTQQCDTVATCNGGRWEVAVPTMTKSACQSGPASDCPSSFTTVPVGQHCDDYGVVCDYPQGRCACTVRDSPTVYDAEAQATWICPSPNSGCPLPRPRLGTPCTAGLECDYGTCAIPGATAEACTDNVWTEESTACPE
jgi:hypothetical protein